MNVDDWMTSSFLSGELETQIEVTLKLEKSGIYKELQSLNVLLERELWLWKKRIKRTESNLLSALDDNLAPTVCLCICVCVCLCVCCTHGRGRVGVGAYRGQRTIFWNQLSSTFTWVLGIELRSPGFHSKCLYPLDHLNGSAQVIFQIKQLDSSKLTCCCNIWSV